MIEFIIPLNLPVRAVTATTQSANAPAWVDGERERWRMRRQASLQVLEELPISTTEPPDPEPMAPPEPIPVVPAGPSELDLQLEALRTSQALFTRAAEQLRNATREVEQRTAGLIQEFQQATVELAHAISSRLIFEDVERGRYPLENLIHEVTSRLEVSAETTIRLHPDDLAIVQQRPTIGDASSDQALKFIADSNLQRGDCQAKAGEINVVYELRRQVDELRRQLLSTVNGHAAT